MAKTLTREAKTQLASSLRRRYQAASSRAKKRILGKIDTPTQPPNLVEFWPPCRAPGEPERSARLTAWNRSRANCDRYKVLYIMTAALHVE